MPRARPFALLLAVAAAVIALSRPASTKADADPWWLIVLAFALVTAAFFGVPAAGTALNGPSGPRRVEAWRRGVVLTAVGATLFVAAGWALQYDWTDTFNWVWISWLAAAVLASVGLDRLWAWWEPPHRSTRRPLVLIIVAFVLVAAVYRLGSFVLFPAESHVVKVEELQNGAIGFSYLQGWRQRWEFIGHTWLAALGIWLGGPSLLSMRLPFTVVSALKVVPLFIWLRFSVGTIGALVGAAFFTFSQWDVLLARMPSNPNAIVIAAAFALLAGPARRGRPSAYLWLGFLGGWVLFEYVAYRPLAMIILIGATWTSLRDRSVGWWRRLVRPAITLAVIVAMALPLGLFLNGTGRTREYFDGWNRARAETSYYGANDSRSELIQKGYQRVLDTGALFLFRGTKSPPLNPTAKPLVDPLTAVLVVLGAGWCVAHAADPVFTLTVIALGSALFGGMVASGNFDAARVSPVVPYIFALAGYGAAGFCAVLQEAWGRAGRTVALAILAVTILIAAHLNGRFLLQLLTSPDVQAVQSSPIVHLTNWLRDQVQPDERVVGVAPGFFNVLAPNDAAWLRGRPMDGVVTWDVETALRDWNQHPSKTALFVYTGMRTVALRRYIEWLLPSVPMEIQEDPTGSHKGDLAFAHVVAPPPDLVRRLDDQKCHGALAEFELVGKGNQESMGYTSTTVPFLDQTTWPPALRKQVAQANPPPEIVHARFRSIFHIDTPGAYKFMVDVRAGSALLVIDGQPIPAEGGSARLQPGDHQLDLKARFKPLANEMMVRLSWQPPDAAPPPELMPLYKIGRPNEHCPSQGS